MSNIPPPPSFDSGGDALPSTQESPVGPLARLGAFAVGVLIGSAFGAVSYGIGWRVMANATVDDTSFTGFVASFFAMIFLAIAAVALGLVPLVIGCIWSIRLWSRSTTPGLKMVRLRVVNVKSGLPAESGQMVLRELVGKFGIYIVLGAIALQLDGKEQSAPRSLVVLSLLIAILHPIVAAALLLVSPTRQATWDLIAKTTVVKAD